MQNKERTISVIAANNTIKLYKYRVHRDFKKIIFLKLLQQKSTMKITSGKNGIDFFNKNV